MLAPDLLFQELIAAQLADLRLRPNLLDDVFRDLSAPTRAQIKTYMERAVIDVRLGWVQTSTKLPAIAITVPGESEAQQYIGSDPGSVYDTEVGDWVPSFYVDQGTYYEDQATQFSGALDAAIYAVNATEASWLAAITKWIALRVRPKLEGAGLVEQRLSVTDFMPASDYPQPDAVYTRVVKMQYTALTYYTLESTDPNDTGVANQVAVDMEND